MPPGFLSTGRTLHSSIVFSKIGSGFQADAAGRAGALSAKRKGPERVLRAF